MEGSQPKQVITRSEDFVRYVWLRRSMAIKIFENSPFRSGQPVLIAFRTRHGAPPDGPSWRAALRFRQAREGGSGAEVDCPRSIISSDFVHRDFSAAAGSVFGNSNLCYELRSDVVVSFELLRFTPVPVRGFFYFPCCAWRLPQMKDDHSHWIRVSPILFNLTIPSFHYSLSLPLLPAFLSFFPIVPIAKPLDTGPP